MSLGPFDYEQEAQEMETKPNSFATLAAINVNDHVEKKSNLTYLSWVWAVDQLMRNDPDASWDYREWDGRPALFLPDETAMVCVKVTAFGKDRSIFLPVMDHRNKAIKNPDAFAINTALQRCLVKAIALHGLGLYIYAGEDLPPTVEGDKGAPENQIPADLKDNAEGEADKGAEAFRAYYKTLDKAKRALLAPLMDDLKTRSDKADHRAADKKLAADEVRAKFPVAA